MCEFKKLVQAWVPSADYFRLVEEAACRWQDSGGKKIGVPRDANGRRRDRRGGVLYRLSVVQNDPTGRPDPPDEPDAWDRAADDPQNDPGTPSGPSSTAEPTPSVNGNGRVHVSAEWPYRLGEWVQTSVVPEPVKIMARGTARSTYHVGFPDGRDFSVEVPGRISRDSMRPRIHVKLEEIVGGVEPGLLREVQSVPQHSANTQLNTQHT